MLRMSHLLTVGHFPDVHVLSLLGPLHPHADAILEEGRDEAEAGEVGQDVLPMPGDLHGKTVIIFRDILRLKNKWSVEITKRYDPLSPLLLTLHT